MNQVEMKTDTQSTEILTFYIGDALLGINILDVQEINRLFEITRVPEAQEHVDGILNLRGRIVTIIDLKKKLGLRNSTDSADRRNIIVRHRDEYIGLIVDAVSNVVKAETGMIEDAPANMEGVKGKYFTGVLKTEQQLIGILDIEQVLA